MKRHLVFQYMLYVLIFGAVQVLVTASGCGGDDDDTEPSGGAGATGAGEGGGGGSGGDSGASGGGEFEECPPTDPPYDNPYCLNVACSLASVPDLSEEGQPKGNCCNTVDVKRKEEAMSSGDTFDLELAVLSYLPKTNPNLVNETVRDVGLTTIQDLGGALILARLKNVPRTEDHPKDSDGKPEAVETTLEIGSGKVNCDGTFSFYGENSAPEPLSPEAGTPNEPSRWVPREVPVLYYGVEGEHLFAVAEEDSAAAGLYWEPWWLADGLEYEFPALFLFLRPKIADLVGDNRSCFGSRLADATWEHGSSTFWLFLPVEPLKHVLSDTLGDQSICGLFALGPMQGDCEGPQASWPSKPPAYCDEETGFCWIGNPEDESYEEFWSEVYTGEDGCDESGAGDRPCCDPDAAEDSALPGCNAYPYVAEVVIGAVDITDNPVGDPSEALSSIELCNPEEQAQ